MRFNCTEPVQTASRVLDIARRLGLEFDDYRFTREGAGRNVIELRLSDPDCHAATIFEARLMEMVDLEREHADA
ncbi:hypothetical protein GQE99_11765 [Maritimibacter sp. DP07]|uniref:Uncharacterized protein n=1 Tax=Maritimibacter harenae TaxID=2606218 RepID=A0A845M835_9RHOB|nr:MULTISPECIES: hypothetical protein [Maritimibacter]MBL6430239.1 hypothetical protein [Maritimibacter sp.]MZR13693.1 hypothetical protein [Maritimibacter harenae]